LNRPKSVRVRHILAKHTGSRRPSSWRQVAAEFAHLRDIYPSLQCLFSGFSQLVVERDLSAAALMRPTFRRSRSDPQFFAPSSP